ncbi:MAG: PEP-CTERM sorting domain-containing protein [Algisphaera sp.]
MSFKKTSLLSTVTLVATVAVSPAMALVINPTYVNAAGETWTADRIGVFDQAIADWTALLATPAGSGAIDVTVSFASAGNGYLGQWSGGFSAFSGDDIRPWSNSVNHSINFNADRMTSSSANALWFDATPLDGSDQPFSDWDALSVARHEIGHMLGFTDGFYADDFNTPTQTDPWGSLIDGSDVFDLSGLNVAMATGNLGHVDNSASNPLMQVAIPNGTRRDVDLVDAQQLALAYGYTLVPEPTTVTVLVLGGLALLRRRRAG